MGDKRKMEIEMWYLWIAFEIFIIAIASIGIGTAIYATRDLLRNRKRRKKLLVGDENVLS